MEEENYKSFKGLISSLGYKKLWDEENIYLLIKSHAFCDTLPTIVLFFFHCLSLAYFPHVKLEKKINVIINEHNP